MARPHRVLGQAKKKQVVPTTNSEALKNVSTSTPASDVSKSVVSTKPAVAQTKSLRSTTVPVTMPGRVDSPVSVNSVESSESMTSNEAATSPNTLLCPICNESMVTLLQLNRHIDDVHSDIEKKDEDILKSWFKKRVEQAKQIHNVTSVFNNKFSKLDIFDNDESSSDTATGNTSTAGSGGSSALGSINTTNTRKTTPVVPIVRFKVTREHWQKPTPLDKCSDVVCDKTLNSRNGSVNCRKCGKLFCTEHTRYQMKLDQNANHDPVNGLWSRCCETCFKSRKGYYDTSGTVVDKTNDYIEIRRKRIDQHELEVNKLEKRLLKLISELSSAKFSTSDGILSYSKANQRRDVERKIIKWEDDSSVTECPICHHSFGYTLRKHHCRLCGRVVCASLSTNCSREAPISLLLEKLMHDPTTNEKRDDNLLLNQLPLTPVQQLQISVNTNNKNGKGGSKKVEAISARETFNGLSVPTHVNKSNDINIRMCKDCKNTVFGKRNFIAALHSPKAPVIVAYERLMPIRRSIDVILPRFQMLLTKVNDESEEPSEETLLEATKIRKKLMSGFVRLDEASRRIQKVEVNSEGEARLKKQIVLDTAQYLQDHMVPLKSLPRFLKKKKGDQKKVEEEDEEESSEDEGTVKDPNEIKELQEQLIVLEEQKFLVSDMVTEASSKRRLDEMIPLQQSLDDLEKEILRIKTKLGKKNQML